MRRLLLLACLAAAQASPVAQTQRQPLQADAVVRLVSELETALESGRLADVRALAAPALAAPDLAILQRALGDTPAQVTLHERARRPVGDGYDVLADVLVTRGRHGRVATWQISAHPGADSPDRDQITALSEVASIDDLLKLTLDTTKQFAVRNLTFEATDMTLRMAAGSAFVAESDAGATAIVLRGNGAVRFAPPEAAEQSQLVILAGRPDVETSIDAAFIRINPAELSERIGDRSLVPTPVDSSELSRAREIFDSQAPRSYNLDLGDLSSERWTLLPPAGTVVADFKTPKFGWLTYALTPDDAEDVSLFDRARKRLISSYASAERLASRGRFYSEDAGRSYDVDRYGLDLTIDPERSWISGRGSLHVIVRREAINALTIKLADALTVSSVSSREFGRLLALRVTGQNNLVVSLPHPIGRGTTLALDVTYSGRLPPQQLDREALAPAADPAQGPDQQQPDLVITPEARFLYSNRTAWYPQATVTDYATAGIRLTVPAEYQIVASGTLTDTFVAPAPALAASGGDVPYGRTSEFTIDRPARYLSCVISRFAPAGVARVAVPVLAPPVSGDAPAGPPSLNLEVVSTPREMGRARQLPSRIADMVHFFASMLGEAPYPNFTVAMIDDNLPGGHSPAYFAIWQIPLATTPYTWKNDPVSFDSYPYFLIAHEVAHQWWGQAIGWKNYHEQWLSEGLAQYFAVLYAGADRGPDMMHGLLAQMRGSAMEMSDQGPIALGYRLGHIQGDSRIFRGIVYNKSALVLDMLRRLIGDEAFTAGLRRFYQEWRFKKAGTDDLRAAFEAGTRIPLGRFFDRWVLGASLPRLRVTSRVEAAGDAATIHVEQAGDVFDLPLTMAVQYADGQTDEVTLKITTAQSDTRVPLKGSIRRIFVRDDLTLATIEK